MVMCSAVLAMVMVNELQGQVIRCSKGKKKTKQKVATPPVLVQWIDSFRLSAQTASV